MENSERPEQTETTEPQTNEQQTEKSDFVFEQAERSIEKALECKNEGNELFKLGQYDLAIDTYKEGLRYCPPDDEKTAAILYSNCSSCYFNLKDYDMCIECAGQAITLNKEYVRPLLSRASAYYELEKYEEANEDYQTVEKLDAGALDKPDIQRRLSVLKKKVDEINEKRKNEVLGNLKDLGNTILGKFGLSIDNFKMQQNENGSYNIAFQK